MTRAISSTGRAGDEGMMRTPSFLLLLGRFKLTVGMKRAMFAGRGQHNLKRQQTKQCRACRKT